MRQRKFLPSFLSLSLGIGCLLVVAALALHAQGANAQASEPAPEKPLQDKPDSAPSSFENASIDDLLKWASKEIGVGFLYSPEKYPDGAGKKITYRPAAATSAAEKRVLLFEGLRELGLVPMPLRGMQSEVYRVVPIAEAAHLSEVSESIEDLEGYYFGTLAFRARVMPFETLVALIAKHASAQAATISVAETSTIVVSDFIDSLRNIENALLAADRPTSRFDDVVTHIYPVERHDPAILTRLLMAARAPNERYAAVSQRGTRVIMLSGPRNDVTTAIHRLDLLEAAPKVDEVTPTLRVLNTLNINGEDLQRALATYFAYEVEHDYIRFAAVPTRDQVLVRCDDADWKRIQPIFREVDRAAQNAEEERNTKRVEERRAFSENQRAERAAAAAAAEAAKKAEKDALKEAEKTPEKAPAKEPIRRAD